ncbi:MAG: glycosyltransferase family 2 protein [Candidatus Staskawiczbacteria bacterium]|nr:glycosyltransferase family 2 protein [Candidatus Staskawiczbacteria bacterium]
MNNDKNNKILLSIAILTYNNARYLENLLNNILPQAEKLKREVEICISNNNSEDNTEEVVIRFKEKYPQLINYNKNKENLGFDRNFLLAAEMSKGDFVWTLGDDDLITENGLNEVIDFIKKSKKEEIGLIFAKTESYFINKITGEKIIHGTGLEKNKPELFKINKEDIISMSLPEAAFISSLIFNNKFLKSIFKEDKEIIEKAVGNLHIHMTLAVLMFLKNHNINGFSLNKRPLVHQELYSYKSFIENKFTVHYGSQKILDSSLLSCKYINNSYASLIIKRDKKLRRGFVIDMITMRAFKRFKYNSFFGCLKLFFQKSTFTDALLFSFIFLILFLIPPIILTSLYKILLIIKYGRKWRFKWNAANLISSFPVKAV